MVHAQLFFLGPPHRPPPPPPPPSSQQARASGFQNSPSATPNKVVNYNWFGSKYNSRNQSKVTTFFQFYFSGNIEGGSFCIIQQNQPIISGNNSCKFSNKVLVLKTFQKVAENENRNPVCFAPWRRSSSSSELSLIIIRALIISRRR
jgi:hypothetical protein